MSDGSHRIEVDEFLPHSPATVWEALTDQQQLADWFMPNDFAPRVGHRFTLDTGRWGTTHCEVFEVQPMRLLRYAWRNGPLDTEVIWRLVPEGDGTRLLVEHRGFDLADPAQARAFDGMSGGWRGLVVASLRTHLSRAAPSHRPQG